MPIYIIQSLDDDTIGHESVNFIFDKLPLLIKHIKFYENVGIATERSNGRTSYQ